MGSELQAVHETSQAAQTYGLEVVLAVGVALMLFFVIRWVLGYFKQAQNSMANIINVTLVNQTAALNEIKTAMMAQNEWAHEAVKRMREEHEEHARWLREIAERH